MCIHLLKSLKHKPEVLTGSINLLNLCSIPISLSYKLVSACQIVESRLYLLDMYASLAYIYAAMFHLLRLHASLLMNIWMKHLKLELP